MSISLAGAGGGGGGGVTLTQVNAAIDAAGTADRTANALVRRDGDGGAVFGNIGAQIIYTNQAPANADHVTRKDYVDGIGTPDSTPNTVARRNEYGGLAFNYIDLMNQDVQNGWNAVRKDYVDGKFTSVGFYGKTPVAQQATPTDLAGVIALLRAYGLCP